MRAACGRAARLARLELIEVTLLCSSCKTFDCTCVCDVTDGACDFNCCCDAECSAAQTAAWHTTATCAAEGPVPLDYKKCIDVDSYDDLVKFNPKDRCVCV